MASFASLREAVDIPPVWLAGCLCLAWSQSQLLPWPGDGGPAVQLAAGLLVGGGILLAVLAIDEMRRQKATVIPHRVPEVLVQSGIFRRSRNPIYLGDLLILAGFCLFWGAWWSLPLVPLLFWILADRFVAPEEARLHEKFGPAFEAYCAKTRRWA
ncbi:isoprenylcysteine carboxylmethyltransferase family protein [Mangrovicoccus sp. HB161399]|uniref:methyltransferase family protein n=1 Tax=Mangrovicoccus sp. HB161399 TaxID=2720392 RepID=UPI00155353D0|nr:isoprenylcysteine carboxylmethyltransferase family protein [Mangrovicoccus sp. HB161399]